ncbi:tyrosine-type recombinase/integrase [Paraburkholderia sp. Ac-20347]|nr:tyrosine-type recombinase/integrase [Paraburkholderia sp. Ac-20347]
MPSKNVDLLTGYLKMAARPRIRKRASWPANLHEPRPGYYVWRDPRTRKSVTLGYMPIEQAIFEVVEANARLKELTPSKRLVERMNDTGETIADLLLKMPNDGVKQATIDQRKYLDRAIKARLGDVKCSELTTKHVAQVLEAYEKQGKMQWAVNIRSRLRAICRRGMALGWMDKNPAEATDRARIKVQRQRLTLDAFNAIRAKSGEVAPWLENAMLLALVSCQDRSTIARWERSFVKGDEVILERSKTGVRIAIPTAIRLNAIGMSLADVITRCRSTGVVSKYLIHHVRRQGLTNVGDPVQRGTISTRFAVARKLAGIKGKGAPSFHEIRSLGKRLYIEQGNVDTKALLGHKSDTMADLYADVRGIEPVKVRIGTI